MSHERARAVGGLRWVRSDALHGALSVLPAMLVILSGNATTGIALALGVLPVCLVGITPTRRLRVIVGVAGMLFAAGIVTGSLLIQVGWLSVPAIFILCFLAARLAARKPLGSVIMSLALPAVGVGLGFSDVQQGLSLALAFVLGSAWAMLTSLLWPESANTRDPSALILGEQEARRYGVILGLTAATAVAAGLILDLDPVGWATTAALLVMRPRAEMVGLRGIGRAVATVVGVYVAVLVLRAGPPPGVIAVLVALVTIATIATRTSLWYVTAAGTAFLILNLSLFGETDPSQILELSWERAFANVLGAGIALFYGVLIASLIVKGRRAAPAAPTPAHGG